MSCREIQAELTAYHFGEILVEARTQIEDHLLGCSSCLRDYLALKREIELGELEPAPSPFLKARVRAAIAQELTPPTPVLRWWARPLAVGIASLAVVLAIAGTQWVANLPGAIPHAFSDKS